MASHGEAGETILIVDDEESVRRTFRDWLEQANLGCRILAAGDAATALSMANEHCIDLAILDWNLGAGADGLQLLEDLVLFNPDVVAIMITGYANQATPLMAMRMGVRDYLDKNQDLDQPTLLAAVRRQLERIRPARRERRINQGLAAFRTAVEQVMPLVQAAAALNDPVPLPEAIRGLFRFVQEATGARAGALLVHGYEAAREPAEHCRAYDADGATIDAPLVPFARSLAGSVVSMQEPHALDDLARLAGEGSIELQPFEVGRRSVLAVPMEVGPGQHVVLELFDHHDAGGKPGPFTPADVRTARTAAELGTDLLRQALAERQTQRILFDAVAAALRLGDEVTQALHPVPAVNASESPAPDVLEQLRVGLQGGAGAIDADSTLRLAEAIRQLAVRHGSDAVEHCQRQVEDLRRLLDAVTGLEREGAT